MYPSHFTGLLELDVSGCPWASVSALCQAVCPCLRLLDLSRVEDLKDSNLRELLAPPNADTRSGEVNRGHQRHFQAVKPPATATCLS